MVLFRLLVAMSMVIQMTIAGPIIEINLDQESEIFYPGYRLPKTVMPKELDIRLTPNMEDMTFSGETKISLKKLNSTVTDIYLHSKGLVYSEISLTPQHSPPITFRYRFIEPYDFLHLNFSRALQNNTDYIIMLKYNGTLQKDLKGFYQSNYIENGVDKYLGTTQFQPGHAREAFPCFDEPGYKAIYKISINCPVNYTCISNMKPMDNSTSLVRFLPTPPMSSYLVAFVISQFKPARQNNETNQFRVWARPEFRGQGTYAFDVGQTLVKRMSTELGIDYYSMGENMKMDHIAIPDFSAGAMENWGLITYRESQLLYDSDETSTLIKLDVIRTIAHEIAHMWFGNYVTCQWWSETWLNEGFARYWERFLINHIDDRFAIEDQFIISQLHNALLVDSQLESLPLTNPDVNSPEEVSATFETITYDKGASIIRMIEHWIGYDNFIAGLKTYLRQYAYGNVVPENLFSHLQDDATLVSYNTTIDEVMGSFTRQSGYPIIHVAMNQTTGVVTLTQEQFLNSDETSDNLYSIPITYTIQNLSNFENTKPAFIMKDRVHTFSWPNGLPHGWITLNIQQTGFYRVSYDDNLLNILLNTLNGNKRTDIHRYNRAQIIDDAMNMVWLDYIPFSKMLKIIDFLKFETDFAPWSAALAGFNNLRKWFSTHDKLRRAFDYYVLKQMDNLIMSLGLESKGNHLEKIFRSNVLKLACEAGHKECIDDSIALFQKLKINGTSVNPDLREHVYCNGLRYGNEDDYDFLWDKYRTSDMINERATILNALGCTRVQDKIIKLLWYTIDNGFYMRHEDRIVAFYSAYNGNLENSRTVLIFFMENIKEIRDSYGSNILNLLTIIPQCLNDELLMMYEEFFETTEDLTDSEKNAGLIPINKIRSIMEWVNSISKNIRK